MTHYFSLECCTKTHIDDLSVFLFLCRISCVLSRCYIRIYGYGYGTVCINDVDRQTVPISIELVQRRRTLAWQVVYAFWERSDAACWKVWESVTRRGHSVVNSGTAARTPDEPWTSEWQLCDWCALGLAASVTTATEAFAVADWDAGRASYLYKVLPQQFWKVWSTILTWSGSGKMSSLTKPAVYMCVCVCVCILSHGWKKFTKSNYNDINWFHKQFLKLSAIKP